MQELKNLFESKELPESYYSEIKNHCTEMGLSLSDDEIKIKSCALQSMYDSFINCKSCQGLETCKNEFPGYKYYGNFTMGKCSKKEAYDIMQQNEKKLASCHIPDRLRQKGLKNFIPDQYSMTAYEMAKKQTSEREEKGIVFYGAVGTGKTHLAAAILNNFIITGGIGLYCVVPQLIDDLRIATKRDNLDELHESLYLCDLLFLDDLGAERVTEFASDELYKIVNSRYLSGKKIICTTNFNLQGLRDHYSEVDGDRITSRLQEMCYFVELNGVDKRK